jgi:hypothetical protein
VAKSNRRRKHDRAVRQAKAARKQAAAAARQVTDLVIREVTRVAYMIRDPATPVEEVAHQLATQYRAGEPVMAAMTDGLIEAGSSPERLARISELWQAEEAAEGKPPSVAYLTFAAGAARTAGDTARARRLLDDALGQADDPESRVPLSAHLRVHGRVADAAELLEEVLRQDPADESAAVQYVLTIEAAFARQPADEPPGPCSCGSGEPGPDCCGPRERAALGRFADRSGLTASQDAVAAYVPRSAYREQIPRFVADWQLITEPGDWADAERASFTAMASELSLILATLPDDDPGPGDAIREDDTNHDDANLDDTNHGDTNHGDTNHGDPGREDNVLTAFAHQPGVPDELADRVRSWTDYVHYGLWQIAEPEPSPGVWCTEIVTGVTRYVAFPAEVIRQFPRWGVLFGAVVPVDGIWRYTGQAFLVSPDEADALCETLTDATEMVVGDLAGKPSKRAARRAREPVPFGRAKPHGVTAYQADGISPETAHLFSMVTANLLLRLAEEVHECRAVPPAMTNSDGDPTCLITARIAVRDAEGLPGLLAGHADFDQDPTEPTRLTWLGRIMLVHQRDTLLADVKARLDAAELGAGESLSDAAAERWVRGLLEVENGAVVAEVNSEERLTRLVDLLRKLGEDPVVTEQIRMDPAQDMAWPAGPQVFPRGVAPPEQGREKYWLDEPVPSWHGQTPRQAARSQDRVHLEALLRRFEYDSDILAAEGKTGVDTAWLRQELDMTGNQHDWFT